MKPAVETIALVHDPFNRINTDQPWHKARVVSLFLIFVAALFFGVLMLTVHRLQQCANIKEASDSHYDPQAAKQNCRDN